MPVPSTDPTPHHPSRKPSQARPLANETHRRGARGRTAYGTRPFAEMLPLPSAGPCNTATVVVCPPLHHRAGCYPPAKPINPKNPYKPCLPNASGAAAAVMDAASQCRLPGPTRPAFVTPCNLPAPCMPLRLPTSQLLGVHRAWKRGSHYCTQRVGWYL